MIHVVLYVITKDLLTLTVTSHTLHLSGQYCTDMLCIINQTRKNMNRSQADKTHFQQAEETKKHTPRFNAQYPVWALLLR